MKVNSLILPPVRIFALCLITAKKMSNIQESDRGPSFYTRDEVEKAKEVNNGDPSSTECEFEFDSWNSAANEDGD